IQPSLQDLSSSTIRLDYWVNRFLLQETVTPHHNWTDGSGSNQVMICGNLLFQQWRVYGMVLTRMFCWRANGSCSGYPLARWWHSSPTSPIQSTFTYSLLRLILR